VKEVIEVLLSRVAHKGVSPDEVPWLIRDVLNAVGETGQPAVDEVNRRLAMLGWDEEILDEVSFALIICLAEERDGACCEHRILT
jgi:hypothetical protein